MATTASEDTLRASLEEGRPVEVQGFTLTESYQNNLENAIRLILESYGREELHTVVYSVVQELALWGSLAVMRQIYFQDHGLDIHNPTDLEKSEGEFQKTINTANLSTYRARAREMGLYLNTRVTHTIAGIRIEVTTNALHSKPLEEKLRRNLRESMAYTDIMEYFRDNPEDTDGRGMGLAFSILMLREDNLRPELMRLGKTDGVVTSRLEIPFDSSFRSIRDRIMRDEVIVPFEGGSLIPGEVQVPLVETRTALCPVCERTVDDKIFFKPASPEMMDVERITALRPQWDPVQGVCASCIAAFGYTDY